MADWIIQKGTDAGISWPIKDQSGAPVDLTGWTGVAQIRAIGTDKLIHTFSSADSNLVLTNSTITLFWTPADTASWKWKQANYGIELITASGKRGRLIQGMVMLSDEVVK